MKVLTIILGILLIIGGIFCIATPGSTFLSIGWLVGLGFLLAGIDEIVMYWSRRYLRSGWALAGGILTALLGGFLLFNSWANFFADMVILYMTGAFLILAGIFRIVTAVQSRHLSHTWGWMLALGILTILVGGYSLFHPTVAAIALGWLIGFYVILAGIEMIQLGINLPRSS